MSKRTDESARLWILVALFAITMVLIGVNFVNAITEINANTLSILETEIPGQEKN